MSDFRDIITKNQGVISALNVARKIAPTEISVLLTGEKGTGKSFFAEAIHNFSDRKDNPFFVINCSSLPARFLNEELFGSNDKGTFQGKLFEAKGGTVFLKEVSAMDIDLQARLMQAIDSRQYLSNSGNFITDIDVRVISSDSRDLIALVEKKKFRMDLYYRLREMAIFIPPIRERKEDIPLLIDFYCRKFAADFGKKINGVSDVAMKFMVNHPWNGNVKELENVVRTAVAICQKDNIWLEDIPLKMELGGDQEPSIFNIESFALKDVEKKHILKTLEHCRWNKSRAARLLKISRPRLDRKISEYKLLKPEQVKKAGEK